MGFCELMYRANESELRPTRVADDNDVEVTSELLHFPACALLGEGGRP